MNVVPYTAPLLPYDNGGQVSRQQHKTLQGRVYQELRSSIRAGRFASGELLTTRGLAAMLGASPVTIREALAG